MTRLFGLIGYPLGHSFSKKYFQEKFRKEGIRDASYELFPIEDISMFPALWENHPNLLGLNVTIPYKEQVIPFLDSVEENAARIGAVNVVKRMPDGTLKGYNSDYFGFRESLLTLWSPEEWFGRKALVLGSGGSARAVKAVLENLNIHFQTVSRTSVSGEVTYEELTQNEVAGADLLVNCTPLGMHPKVNACPPIPYDGIHDKQVVMDLVYNPEETLFLKIAGEKGARVRNGMEMLVGQAEKAWSIWNEES